MPRECFLPLTGRLCSAVSNCNEQSVRKPLAYPLRCARVVALCRWLMSGRISGRGSGIFAAWSSGISAAARSTSVTRPCAVAIARSSNDTCSRISCICCCSARARIREVAVSIWHRVEISTCFDHSCFDRSCFSYAFLQLPFITHNPSLAWIFWDIVGRDEKTAHKSNTA